MKLLVIDSIYKLDKKDEYFHFMSLGFSHNCVIQKSPIFIELATFSHNIVSEATLELSVIRVAISQYNIDIFLITVLNHSTSIEDFFSFIC